MDLIALCLKGGSWKSNTPKGVMEEITPRSRFITEENAEADRRAKMGVELVATDVKQGRELVRQDIVYAGLSRVGRIWRLRTFS